jgi:peroxiredoxin Q/BCP
MVKEGDPFPDFSLADQAGAVHTLNELKGANSVIYFYPKDDTPGCTAEACSFRDNLPKFEGVKVLGVSPDSAKSHQKFIDKFDLNFPLLADTDKKLSEAVGVWVEKSMYGKTYMGVERTTILLDENGVIKKIWRKVKVDGHTEEVLAALK